MSGRCGAEDFAVFSSYLGGVVADLLDVGRHLLHDLLIPLLRVLGLGGVHLVEGNDHLLHTQGVGQQGVLAGLAILGDTSLETTRGGVNDQDSAIGLGGSGNHVLDEVTVTGGVDDSAVVSRGLELPQSDIDGDTTLALGLELVKHLQRNKRWALHRQHILVDDESITSNKHRYSSS